MLLQHVARTKIKKPAGALRAILEVNQKVIEASICYPLAVLYCYGIPGDKGIFCVEHGEALSPPWLRVLVIMEDITKLRG